MINGIALAAAAVAAAMLVQTLRSASPESAFGLRVAASVGLAAAVLGALLPVWTELAQWMTRSAAGEWIVLLAKSMGVCLVAQFAADCCRDAGESALAGRVEFVGRAAVLVQAMPLVRALLQWIDVLLDGGSG